MLAVPQLCSAGNKVIKSLSPLPKPKPAELCLHPQPQAPSARIPTYVCMKPSPDTGFCHVHKCSYKSDNIQMHIEHEQTKGLRADDVSHGLLDTQHTEYNSCQNPRPCHPLATVFWFCPTPSTSFGSLKTRGLKKSP